MMLGFGIGLVPALPSRLLGLVGIQDSHPYLIVIQGSDGAIRFD